MATDFSCFANSCAEYRSDALFF